MKKIHWFETKQLDRVTNYSTEIEPLKMANKMGVNFKYYCTYYNSKFKYGLENNINYLGFSRNRIIKHVTFRLLVIIKTLKLSLENNHQIMVNQDLIIDVLPSLFLSRILKRKNKYIVDVRTTPTNPDTFDDDMKKLHQKFKYAIKYFDGFSFITPFMQKTLLESYKSIKKTQTVQWSSGVDMQIFNYSNFSSKFEKNSFKVFYHGGISESRGNLSLIKACEKLVKKGLNIKLQQVGVCVDISIINYINKNNLSYWCELLPPVDLKEIPQLIANADLPVLPFPNFLAWRVSSPIKLMEYLAMGKKVLAPKYEAFTDLFGETEKNIFYYDANQLDEVKELANAIERILKSDLLSIYKPIDQVNFVKNNVTWEAQSKKLINFCLSI